MRKLLRIALTALVAGTVIAITPCVAADKAAPASAKAVEAGTAASGAKTAPATGELDYIASLQAAEETKPKATEDEPSMPVTIVGFIFKLALVLGLCYVTMLGLKKFGSVKSAVGASRGRIRVVENSNLGANRTLHLVEIGSKRLLVASTPSQVNLLAELEIEDIPEPAPQEPVVQGFKDQLALFLGNKADTTKSAMTVAQMLRDSSSYMQGRVREVGSFRRVFRNAENR